MTSRSGTGVLTAETVNLNNFPDREFFFPSGLLGFPTCQRFKLERFNPDAGDESPFLTLNSLDENLSFPLIHPDAIALHYRFPVDVELLSALAARSQEDLVPLLIVTVRERLEDITLNLQGPLIVNPTSSLGLQLIVEEYPLRYRLFETPSA